MSPTRGGSGKDLGPEDFDSIREAVMETPRGRWFLGEFEQRLRRADTAGLLDSMKRLEAAVNSNHAAIMQRLAEALARGPEAAAAPAPVQPQADLAPRHMKYFKQDEEIFEPAPQARIAAVPEPPKAEAEARPAVPKGARLIIRRTSERTATVEASAAAEAAAPAALAPEPAAAAEPSSPSPAPSDAHDEAQPKRRIVIIRHKPGEDIDVPLQDEMAQAS